MHRVKYSSTPPGEKRQHVLTPADIEVLLGRLPEQPWSRLQTVHFNDRSRGCRMLGYVNEGRRDIAICALPPRVSLTRFLVGYSRRQRRGFGSPETFGATRRHPWPELAVRRFMLYEVFLHELGHLQVIVPNSNRTNRRYAGETRAEMFATQWRNTLWSQHFDHPDPIHNRPTAAELPISDK